MDFDYILDRRLAVGGGIWTREAMAELARLGFTHVLNLQAEFDDSGLAAECGVAAFWIPTEDDLAAKPAEFFERVADCALAALSGDKARVYVHCAAGVHRGPLATAAILYALGFDVEDAMALVAARRLIAEFPDVYAASLRAWAEARMVQLAVDPDNPGGV